jgi:hypothetical protein
MGRSAWVDIVMNLVHDIIPLNGLFQAIQRYDVLREDLLEWRRQWVAWARNYSGSHCALFFYSNI